MLHSLESTGLGAKLQPRAYDAYQKEVEKIEEEWDYSLHFLITCDYSIKGGIESDKIPSPCCQVDCPDIWDNDNSQVLEKSYLASHPALLIAEGGSVPCTFRMILKYFDITKNLENICGVLVRRGYHIKDTGILTLAFDKVLEQIYGVKTEIQPSIFDLCESVSLGHPVIALVTNSWLYNNGMDGLTCIIIWQLKEKEILVSTTTSRTLQVLDMVDTFEHIQRAWACHK